MVLFEKFDFTIKHEGKSLFGSLANLKGILSIGAKSFSSF